MSSTIYRGGPIITMRGPEPEYVEALVVTDGLISFVGSADGAVAVAGAGAEVVDLAGRALLPGFIDTHGHFVYAGRNGVDGKLRDCDTVASLVAKMKDHAATVPDGEWIVGFGYKPRDLAENRQPTAAELDEVSSDRPVMIVDSSGHAGSMNSVLMGLAGITAETPDPEGGHFYRVEGSQDPLGPMEETALNFVRAQRPAMVGESADRVISSAAAEWAATGHTTAMECGLGLGSDDVSLVRNAIDKNLLPIDLVVYAKDANMADVKAGAEAVSAAYADKPDEVDGIPVASRPDGDRRYVNRVRLGGVKFWLDGATDTAWTLEPYTNPPPGRPADYCAYQQIPDEVLDEFFAAYWRSPVQVNLHMNGDAAAEQALRAIEKAIDEQGEYDHRPVFVHASILRPDQLDRIKEVGAVPSYLSGALGGSLHVALHAFGPDRPVLAAKSARERGIPVTISHDYPVSPTPSVMAGVYGAVNRRSDVTGEVVNPEECLTAYEALQAMTATAAYQLKEETTKGTLEPGKLADMVILAADPLAVDPSELAGIRVEQTVKDGVPVFTAAPEDPVIAPAPGDEPGICPHPDDAAGAAVATAVGEQLQGLFAAAVVGATPRS